MNGNGIRFLVPLLATAIPAVALAAAPPADDRPPPPLRSFAVCQGYSPWKIVGTEHQQILGQFRAGPDGHTRAEFIILFHAKPLATDSGDAVHYPPLRFYDYVPAFGHLYQVSPNVNGPGLRFTWVPPWDAPAGAVVPRGSIAIPLATPEDTGNSRLHQTPIRVEAIIRAAAGGDPQAVVIIRRLRDPEAPRKGRATVRAGDVLAIGRHGHRVLAVVPRDDKRQIIGWLALGREAIPLGADHPPPARLIRPEEVD